MHLPRAKPVDILYESIVYNEACKLEVWCESISIYLPNRSLRIATGEMCVLCAKEEIALEYIPPGLNSLQSAWLVLWSSQECIIYGRIRYYQMLHHRRTSWSGFDYYHPVPLPFKLLQQCNAADTVALVKKTLNLSAVVRTTYHDTRYPNRIPIIQVADFYIQVC